ncbi:MAG: Protein translocase subunit SecE [Candidatus Marinimicrobia bacterium]|nr:Protein translocase subunit SecE [Candidatus Neomarinimicrobiota bacterium]
MIEKIQNYIQEVIFEFKKVSWPPWEELKGSTIVVLALTAFFAVLLFVTDFILSRLMSLVLGA